MTYFSFSVLQMVETTALNLVKNTIFLYNTMMNRPLSTIGILMTVLMLPMHALAYVTPEDALDDKTYTTRFYDPPPSIRSGVARQEEQKRVSEERRNAELSKVMPKEEVDSLHSAAPTENTTTDIDKMIELIKLLQSDTKTETSVQTDTPAQQEDARAALDPVSQRLLMRAEAQRATVERAAFVQSLMGEANGDLHSGAPLADTGPATVFVTLAIAGAIGETLRRVRKKEMNS